MTPEPRVLVVTPDFPPAPGGIQQLVHRIAQHAEGLRTHVVTVGSRGAHEFDSASALHVRRVSEAGGRQLAIAKLNATALVEAGRFDPAAVLSGHIVTAPAAALLRKALDIPVLQYLYAEELGARPRLTAFALRNADAAVAISRYTYDLAIAAGARASRLHQVPPGVDLPEVLDREPADRPTVLTVARLSERYKGHDVMLRALPLIRALVPDVEWVVVGDGPLRPWLESTSADLGLQGSVRFVGSVSDAERDRWLRRAQVFTMPSRVPAGGFAGEGFGIVYLEAGAHGIPVVAGDVGGALDAVVPDVTGVLVDPTDHVELANAIADLLLDQPRAQALGAAGVQRARELAWPVIARRIEDLLVTLMGQDARSSHRA